MNPPDFFRRLSVLLDNAGISYMVTGSFARSVYGMGRASQDVDLIIVADESQIAKLFDLLPANEFYPERDSALEACCHESMFNLIDNITGMKIDFIFRKARAFSVEEFQRRRSSLVQGVPLCIASPEDIIVAKLECAKMGASLRQMEDVVSILKFRNQELDSAYIEKWVKRDGSGEVMATGSQSCRTDLIIHSNLAGCGTRALKSPLCPEPCHFSCARMDFSSQIRITCPSASANSAPYPQYISCGACRNLTPASLSAR